MVICLSPSIQKSCGISSWGTCWQISIYWLVIRERWFIGLTTEMWPKKDVEIVIKPQTRKHHYSDNHLFLPAKYSLNTWFLYVLQWQDVVYEHPWQTDSGTNFCSFCWIVLIILIFFFFFYWRFENFVLADTKQISRGESEKGLSIYK